MENTDDTEKISVKWNLEERKKEIHNLITVLNLDLVQEDFFEDPMEALDTFMRDVHLFSQACAEYRLLRYMDEKGVRP